MCSKALTLSFKSSTYSVRLHLWVASAVGLTVDLIRRCDAFFLFLPELNAAYGQTVK